MFSLESTSAHTRRHKCLKSKMIHVVRIQVKQNVSLFFFKDKGGYIISLRISGGNVLSWSSTMQFFLSESPKQVSRCLNESLERERRRLSVMTTSAFCGYENYTKPKAVLPLQATEADQHCPVVSLWRDSHSSRPWYKPSALRRRNSLCLTLLRSVFSSVWTCSHLELFRFGPRKCLLFFTSWARQYRCLLIQPPNQKQLEHFVLCVHFVRLKLKYHHFQNISMC